jgi:hypothetical protein
MIIPPKFRWIRLYNYMRREPSQHIVFFGATGSGKTYFVYWLCEQDMLDKAAKPVILKCMEPHDLEESLGFLVPNTANLATGWKEYDEAGMYWGKQKFRESPRSFKVHVYVPITKGIPDKLPENFVPFTGSVKQVSEKAYRLLHLSKEYVSAWAEFKSMRDKLGAEATFADAKRMLRRSASMQSRVEKNWFGEELMYSGEKSAPTTYSVMNRMRAIADEGFLASDKNPYEVRKMLRKELLEQDTVVVLYTGFISSKFVKLFVMQYFMDTIHDIMDREGYKDRISRKSKITFVLDDVRDVMQSTTSRVASEADIVMSEITTDALSTYRKAMIKIWTAVHSPQFLSNTSMINFQQTYCTRLESETDLDWLAKMTPRLSKQTLQQMFSKWGKLAAYKHDYRFMEISNKSDPAPVWYDQRNLGYKLPRERLCAHSLPLKGTNWEELRKLGFKITDAGKRARLALAKEWATAEKGYIEKYREARKHDKTDDQELAARIRFLIEVVEQYRQLKTLRKTVELFKDRGIKSRDALKTALREALKYGLITEAELARLGFYGKAEAEEAPEDKNGSADVNFGADDTQKGAAETS